MTPNEILKIIPNSKIKFIKSFSQQVYAMSNVVGPSALGYHLSRKICVDVISILTIYTSTGVWRPMIREVFKYIPSAPHTFITGLDILSQLLPLPLPMQTQSVLTGQFNHSNTKTNLDSIKKINTEVNRLT
jgi:hypothetical protein